MIVKLKYVHKEDDWFHAANYKLWFSSYLPGRIAQNPTLIGTLGKSIVEIFEIILLGYQ